MHSVGTKRTNSWFGLKLALLDCEGLALLYGQTGVITAEHLAAQLRQQSLRRPAQSVARPLRWACLPKA